MRPRLAWSCVIRLPLVALAVVAALPARAGGDDPCSHAAAAGLGHDRRSHSRTVMPMKPAEQRALAREDPGRNGGHQICDGREQALPLGRADLAQQSTHLAEISVAVMATVAHRPVRFARGNRTFRPVRWQRLVMRAKTAGHARQRRKKSPLAAARPGRGAVVARVRTARGPVRRLTCGVSNHCRGGGADRPAGPSLCNGCRRTRPDPGGGGR